MDTPLHPEFIYELLADTYFNFADDWTKPILTYDMDKLLLSNLYTDVIP